MLAPSVHVRPDWFPDWSRDLVAVVGSGESATHAALNALRGRCKVVVVNTTYKLAPWADVLYACDWKWWGWNSGAFDFAGLRVSQDERAVTDWYVKRVVVAGKDVCQILVEQPGVIGSGQNGGFQALNLAVQFGARRIITLLDYRPGRWHGNHPGEVRAGGQRPETLAKWALTLDGQAGRLAELGVCVIDAANDGALTAFPKMAVPEALEALGA